MIDAFPSVGIEKRARKFDALLDAVPGDFAIAFARALPKPIFGLFGRRADITLHRRDFEEAMQRSDVTPVTVDTTAGKFFAVPDGNRMTVCKVVAQHSPAEAKKQLEHILRTGGTEAEHNALRAMSPPVPGRRVGAAPIDPAWRALALDLGLPEALGLATDGTEMETERLIFIRRGMPLAHDAKARKSKWRFPFAKPGALTIALSPAGAEVKIEGSSEQRQYPADVLAQYRRDHTRP